MACRLILALLLGAPCSLGAELTVEHLTALAKTYFRDSAEVPMSVAVTTVVTDPAGKVKHRGHSTVSMVFQGYNQGAKRYSLRANSGWFNTGALRDSLGGDLAAFLSASFLLPDKESTAETEIQQAREAGKPVVVLVRNRECGNLELLSHWMFPKNPCGLAQFSLSAGNGGELSFQQFQFDSLGKPGACQLAYLGEVQLTGYHAEVEFQKGFLAGDSKPYLWPKRAVISATTNKGKVTITNEYSPKK